LSIKIVILYFTGVVLSKASNCIFHWYCFFYQDCNLIILLVLFFLSRLFFYISLVLFCLSRM
jgi:hypothetical protein